MIITGTIPEVRDAVANARKEGRKVTFVPTMGYLHEGHLSLVDRARRDDAFVVVSSFVNPKQFGPNEDFDAYPRDQERDAALLRERDVDLLFMPDRDVIYPEGFATRVLVGGPANPLEGSLRPGHFEGVATVVCRLFNIVRPDVAIFGQKDAQQCAVVRRMVADLALPIEIEIGEVVREQDGLAMSSRNVRLAEGDRDRASALYASLRVGAASWVSGIEIEKNVRTVESEMMREAKSRDLDVEYLGVVDADTFLEPESESVPILLVGAARVGTVRLIDNVVVNSGGDR